jgi:hypothetical protein
MRGLETMNNKDENKIDEIMSLKNDGDSASVAWSEGGGGMVYYFKGLLVLFSVPQYGGPESFENVFYKTRESAAQIIETCGEWT